MALHEEAAETVGRAWGLPPELTMIVAHHHHHLTIGGYDHPVIAALCVGQEIAQQLGYDLQRGGHSDDQTHPNQLRRALDAPGLTPLQAETVAAEAVSALQSASQ